jgi:hypothetical protein
MVRRTRNMCRVVGQPISKGTFPVWFKKLAIHIEAAEAPASDDVSGLYGSDGEEESSDGDSKPLSSWDVKFNKELMIATRSSIAEPRQQISQPIVDNPDAADIDMVHAAFVTEAGTISMVIPGLTFEGLRKLSRAVHAAPGRLWSQEHTSTKHRIYIEQRVDRKLLLSLYEQSKQRLQVRVDSFGQVADQTKQLPKDHPALVKALAFMVDIGTMFANGEIGLGDLKRHRDEKMAATMKAPPSSRQRPPLARPAAAHADTGRSLKRPAAASAALRPKDVSGVAQPQQESSALPPKKAAATPKIQRRMQFDPPIRSAADNIMERLMEM